jgi:hypothetical protein
MYHEQPFEGQLSIFITERTGCNMGIAASSLPFKLLLSWGFTCMLSRGLSKARRSALSCWAGCRLTQKKIGRSPNECCRMSVTYLLINEMFQVLASAEVRPRREMVIRWCLWYTNTTMSMQYLARDRSWQSCAWEGSACNGWNISSSAEPIM